MVADRETHAIPVIILWGYCCLWAVFEILAVPCIFYKRTLVELVRIYGVAVAALSFAAVLFFREKMKEDFASWKQGFSKIRLSMAGFFAVIDVFLILAQAAFVFLYMHEDADDSEYVVMANDAWERGGMLITNPYTGFKWENATLKRMISPFSFWIAAVSKITGISPARLSHAWIPALMVLLGYVAVFVALQLILSRSWEKKEEGYRWLTQETTKNLAPWLAIFFFSLLVIFGGTTTRSYGSMLLLRAWQGKAVFCAVLLPLILSEMILWGERLMGQEQDSWIAALIRFLILCLASLLATGMSIPMIPLLAGAFGVVYGCEWILRRFR
ncbi:MAG: hypothetical protein IJ679_09210 [Lachnospiraceae bacterium]|nr:hypothetical protein [Lachnospiraceae bacterium]